jgi:DNA polymerase I
MILGLPFREIIAIDFEFETGEGENPKPVCMVAKEIGSGRLIKSWQDQLSTTPPFPIDDETLIIAYYASAEIGCFLQLDWPVPTRIIDLYAEFKRETNALAVAEGRGLLGALTRHHITKITSEEKRAGRDLVLRGGPWTDSERREILDYCTSDVVCLPPLLEAMLPAITSTPQGLGQALLRGRYTAAVARMERVGVPIDTQTLTALRNAWSGIKLDLIQEVDQAYRVYEGGTFKAGLFAKYLADRHISWPRTETGRLVLDQDTFKDMAKVHPELAPLRELRHSLSELRLEKLGRGFGRTESDPAQPVRCQLRPEHSEREQVHLWSVCVAPRFDQTRPGDGCRLHRLQQSGGGDCGGTKRRPVSDRCCGKRRPVSELCCPRWPGT